MFLYTAWIRSQECTSQSLSRCWAMHITAGLAAFPCGYCRGASSGFIKYFVIIDGHFVWFPVLETQWLHLHALLQYVPAGLLLHFAGRCRSHFGGVVFYICLPKPEVPTHPVLCDIMALAFTCCNTAPWDILYSSFIYEKTLANYSSCIHSVVLFSNHLKRLYRSE